MNFRFIQLTVLFTAGALVLLFGTQAIAHSGDEGCLSFDYAFNSINHSTITLKIDYFNQESIRLNNGIYTKVSLGQGSYIHDDQAGYPGLPSLNQSLMIPDTGKMGVRVINSRFYDMENMNIAPHRGAILRTVDPATVPYTFNEVYSKDAWFPAEPAALRAPYIMRDVRGQVLEIYPFQYNPVTKILRVYTELEIEIAQIDAVGHNEIDRATYGFKPDKTFDAMYQNQFPNYKVARTEPPTESGDMLIISHGAFMPNMQSFVDHKVGRGIDVTMVDVATIGNNATAIGNYIDNLYGTSNLAYVLIVGDYDEVKCPDYSGGPSDPAYSTITPDWYPDLLIGRFSAQNTGHVDTQVQRTLAHETTAHDVSAGGYNTRGLGVASNQGPGHHGEAGDDVHCDLIRDELFAIGFTEVERSYDYFGTKTIIRNAINNGVLILNYTGHGGVTGWGNGGGFSNSDVHALTNVGMLPFVIGVACNPGEFDYNECFGEAWQWATHNGQPTGSVANYHSSISQSWDPPMTGQGNHSIGNSYGAMERFCLQMNQTVGGCWFGGSCAMMDDHGSGGREMFMTWIIFGDPSCVILGDTGPVTLDTDGWSIPIDTATQINYTIQPGVEYANANYAMIGGMSGTYPGFDMPGAYAPHVPINIDSKTLLFFDLYATSMFTNFIGVLDGSGEAVATFDSSSLIPIHPRKVGKSLNFSAVVWHNGDDYEFATNAKSMTITN